MQQGNAERAMQKDPCLLKFVPDWVVTQQKIKISLDDSEYCNDDEVIEWYKGHQKRKAQKAKIKDGLMPIAWYRSR